MRPGARVRELRLLIAAIAVAATFNHPIARADPVIGLYSNGDCSECQLSVPSGSSSAFFLRVHPVELAGELITGAEFRIVGIPAGWAASFLPPASGLEVGDVLGTGGALVLLSPVSGDCIDIGRVEITATSSESEVTITIDTPATRPCPLVSYVTPAFPPRRCASGTVLWINSSDSCRVATARGSWSTMKELFR